MSSADCAVPPYQDDLDLFLFLRFLAPMGLPESPVRPVDGDTLVWSSSDEVPRPESVVGSSVGPSEGEEPGGVTGVTGVAGEGGPAAFPRMRLCEVAPS